MTNLLWPGDERAGDLCSDETFLAAMVALEEAWLGPSGDCLGAADAFIEAPLARAAGVLA